MNPSPSAARDGRRPPTPPSDALRNACAHRLLDLARTLSVALDRHGRVVVASAALCEALGWSEEELVGRDWFEFAVGEERRDTARAVHARVVAGDLESERLRGYGVLDRKGEPLRIAWRHDVVRDADGGVLGSVGCGVWLEGEPGHDRDLRSTTREIHELKYALDQAAIVVRTDPAGKITYVNDRFCEISGYSREELLGRTHRLVNSGHHPPSFMRDLWQTISSGEVWRGELCNRAKDGHTYWVDSTLVPLRGEDGRIEEYVAIRTDVTGRKEAERTLREKESLTRLGEMASVVAHEVRNPLAGIGGALQIILRRMDPAAPERAVVGDILERIRTLDETLEDLLAFARPKRARPIRLEVTPLLRSILDRVRDDPRTVGVAFDLEPSDVICMADPGMLNGALLNLLLNAAQATGEGGRVRVRSGAEDGWCRIQVIDDGPGIPVENRERIFEPFFTTRARGTGLGLPTVRRWVEAQGGELSFECPSRGGTVMTVRLALPPR